MRGLNQRWFKRGGVQLRWAWDWWPNHRTMNERDMWILLHKSSVNPTIELLIEVKMVDLEAI